jgi:DNA-binding GntR family transcriptional regulator
VAVGAQWRRLEHFRKRLDVNGTMVSDSLSDKVFQHLSAMLASEDLKLGDHINAGRIAAELKVSRTTVSKAIDRLTSEGWVKPDERRRPVAVAYPPKPKDPEPSANFEFTTRTDSTYELLLSRILRGDFKPGDIIKERRIAHQQNVNATTIRRAAERLRNDGLLEYLPRRGWQVSTLAAQDLRDAFRLRLLVEPVALEAAVVRIDDAIIDTLERETDRLIHLGEQPAAYERRDADHRFHHTLAEASGSRLMVATLEPLLRRSLLVTTVGFPFGRSMRSYEEHHEILAAMRRRDVEAAKQAMTRHLENALRFGAAIWEHV